MAFTFPMTRAEFMDLLPVQDVRFFVGQQHQLSGTGGGEILKAEVAPPLWRGSVDLAPMSARAAAEIEALLATLEGPGASFEAYKKNQIGPKSDTLGAALSGYAPTLDFIDEATSEIKLAALPNGYSLSRGDFISFTYGTSQALHRLGRGRTADALGVTFKIDLVPHLRPGAVVATAVELIQPYCKAVLVPGSVNFGSTRNGVTSGMAFQFQQTLR